MPAASGDELAPTVGARYLLERIDSVSGEASARYRAAIHTPDAVFEYEVTLELAGSAALEARGPAAGPALEANLTAIARAIARSAGKHLAEGMPPWPRRVLRWRGPGRGR
jgi:hypothetical protein